jgi:outer membrane protein TolC
MSNVYELRPPAAVAAVVEFESVEAAVRELSARIAENNGQRRQLFSRLDELRGQTPSLRRRRPRPLPPALPNPVTFFSIEEAADIDVATHGRTPALAAGGMR